MYILLYIAIPNLMFRQCCILNFYIYLPRKLLKFSKSGYTINREIIIYKLTMLYYQVSYMDITEHSLHRQ